MLFGPGSENLTSAKGFKGGMREELHEKPRTIIVP